MTYSKDHPTSRPRKMFGGYFYIDERPINIFKKPAIYLFSRPFNLRSAKQNDTRKIYTTKLLKSSMLCTDNIRNTIEVINDDGITPYNIDLPNGEVVHVRAFQLGNKALNVVFLFEHQNRYTLYADRLIPIDAIMENKFLVRLMRAKKIDDLKIDLTAYDITEVNLKRSACREIQKIIGDTSNDYKFHMLIDDFGYEDLIFELATKYGVKIFLDGTKSAELFRLQQCLDHFCIDQTEADIILVNKLATDTKKQFYEDNIISIKLTMDSSVASSDHLRIVRYTFYPTQGDIYQIVSLFVPEKIISINDIDVPPALEQLKYCYNLK